MTTHANEGSVDTLLNENRVFSPSSPSTLGLSRWLVASAMNTRR